MFTWFGVTEEQLRTELEIPTPIDILRWNYCNYIKEHPITQWSIPTDILYGGKDNMQSINIITDFRHKFGCNITTSPNSEHPFMESKDSEIVENWLKNNIT